MVSLERILLHRTQFRPHGSVVFGEGSFGGEFLTTWFLMDFGRLNAIKGRVSNILAVDVSFSRM